MIVDEGRVELLLLLRVVVVATEIALDLDRLHTLRTKPTLSKNKPKTTEKEPQNEETHFEPPKRKPIRVPHISKKTGLRSDLLNAFDHV